MNTATAQPTSASQEGERKQRETLAALVRLVTARPKDERQPERPATATAAPKSAWRRAPGQQVRLRLGQAAAEQLRELPARVRSEVATLAINAALAGVPVARLVGCRQELKNLGLLLNQSLRVSRGQSVNVEALAQAVGVVQKLSQR
jgi:hypothetical protein